MRIPAQRGFDATGNYRDIRIKLAKDVGINHSGVVRPHSVPPVGGIGIVAAATPGCGVMIDHRIHRPSRHPEKQTRTPEFPKITQIVLPVGLWHDSHTVSPLLHQRTPYHRRTERGMVNVGIPRKNHYIHLVPSTELHLLDRSRQPVGQH